MMSITSKAIFAAAGLLLAGSPAFAAGHNFNRDVRRDDLSAPAFRQQLPVASSRGDNSSPYIGLWVEGYPRSSLR